MKKRKKKRERPTDFSCFSRILRGFPIRPSQRASKSFFTVLQDCPWIPNATKRACQQFFTLSGGLFLDFRCDQQDSGQTVSQFSQVCRLDFRCQQERCQILHCFCGIVLGFSIQSRENGVVVVSLFDALTTPQSQYIQFTTCSALPHTCAGLC